MTEPILGDPPRLADDTWSAAVARAVDPTTSFDPTLLPDEAPPVADPADLADPADPAVTEPADEPAAHDPLDDAPLPADTSTDTASAFDEPDADPFDLD